MARDGFSDKNYMAVLYYTGSYASIGSIVSIIDMQLIC